MHIGTKAWLMGYENWAVPTSPGIHIGPFPGEGRKEHTYRLYADSGKFPTTVGFLVSAFVLGGEEMMRRVATAVKRISNLNVEANWEHAKQLGAQERANLLNKQVMSYEDYLTNKPWEV